MSTAFILVFVTKLVLDKETVIEVHRDPTIYHTWDDCEAARAGYSVSRCVHVYLGPQGQPIGFVE